MNVHVETSRFRNDLPQYANDITIKLLQPTDDSRVIVKAALAGLQKIWRDKYHYNRCGAMLLDLKDANTGKQEALFGGHQREQSEVLMNTLDRLNGIYGKNTIKLAAQGGDGKAWALRSDFRSPRYLTRLDENIKLKS